MKSNLSSRSFLLTLLLAAVPVAMLSHRAAAEAVEIRNPGLEEPGFADVKNVSFDGVIGGMGAVPGWSSNEPGDGGVIHYEEQYPGRTGNNVLYLHGTGDQNFYTQDFALDEDLQSNTTYVLTFDVLRWKNVTVDDTVVFRAGLYTGVNYENRVPLKQFEGSLRLVDKHGDPVDKVTLTLVYKTGQVPPGTKFWIGGDALGNSQDAHRAHFDNFSLRTAIP